MPNVRAATDRYYCERSLKVYINRYMIQAMTIVRRIRKLAKLTQSELADLAGTSQSAIAAYESGSKTPSLRTVRRIASAVGMDLHMSPVPALTREERRSLALHEAIAERIHADPDTAMAKARTNLDQMRRIHPHALKLLTEWESVLELPVQEVADVLTDPSPRYRELRHVTPFAGVLAAGERSRVYRRFRAAEARV